MRTPQRGLSQLLGFRQASPRPEHCRSARHHRPTCPRCLQANAGIPELQCPQPRSSRRSATIEPKHRDQAGNDLARTVRADPASGTGHRSVLSGAPTGTSVTDGGLEARVVCPRLALGRDLPHLGWLGDDDHLVAFKFAAGSVRQQTPAARPVCPMHKRSVRHTRGQSAAPCRFRCRTGRGDERGRNALERGRSPDRLVAFSRCSTTWSGILTPTNQTLTPSKASR